MGATLSNMLGQMVVEKYDHVTSLMGSLVISLLPILIFTLMPETLNLRDEKHRNEKGASDYKSMA